jgi:hypothetical protein
VKGRTSGFYFDKAINITVRNCSVQWGNNRPDYFAYAMESGDVAGLKISGFEGQSAFPKKLGSKNIYVTVKGK